MINRVIFAVLFLFSSCASQQKQAERAYRFFRVHPQALATLCARQYPVRKEYKTGSEIIQVDTITSEGIQVPGLPQASSKNSFYKCPPNTKIIQRVTRIDTVFAENTALVAQLSTQLEECTRKALQSEDLAKKLGWGILLVVAFFFAFYLCFIKTKF